MKSFLPICFAAVLLCLASNAQTIITFDVPGGINTQPVAISAFGEITGAYQDPNTTKLRGFLRTRTGKIVTFDVSGMNTFPAAINAAGQVTGIYTSNDAAVPPFHSFLRQPDGTIVTFDAPDAWDTESTAIDESGEIAGWTQSVSSDPVAFHGFIRKSDGRIVTFDLNDAGVILPSSMNFSGKVIGYWTDIDANRGRGFLRQPGGRITNIDVPASLETNTWPYGINARGEIVGAYTFQCPFPPGNCTTDSHGFLREPDGRFISIDVPNMTYSVPVAIDFWGQVSGYAYQDSNQQLYGFLRERNEHIVTFEVPNSIWTEPLAMSFWGEVTGLYFDASGDAHGFIFSQRAR